MNGTLRREEKKDYRPVEHLTREAFWDLYHPGCSEHLVLHNLRLCPDFIPELDYVALEDGKIVGHIAYSRAAVVDEQGVSHEVITFGPVSVLPARQRSGIGRMLIEHTLDLARGLGYKAVILFGSPAYYHRFGFQNAEAFSITTSDGDNFDPFMALELYSGSLSGIHGKFFESESFHVSDAELDEFDKQFPFKEKHVTDTQLK